MTLMWSGRCVAISTALASDGETDGVNCFYDEELQNASSIRRKLPLNHNSRGFNSLSDRLLKTMVANEIKKTLDGEDNKKLVAHHRPVLHAESEASESEMVVLGVVFSSKQIQNEEVSKAIDMLQRNGVNCVCFTLKDSLQNGERKDDNNVQPRENGDSSSTEEILKTLTNQQANENSLSAENQELSPAQKKVSSPTISTTSDYASPPPNEPSKDDEMKTFELLDSCTSTTAPVLTSTAIVEAAPVDDEASSVSRKKKPVQRRGTKKAKRRKSKKAEPELDLLPALSPSPPILLPQILNCQSQDAKEENAEGGSDDVVQSPDATLTAKTKPATDSTEMRRKKRRKRLYPYVSRRKSKSKKKKLTLPSMESVDAPKQTRLLQIKPLVPAQSIPADPQTHGSANSSQTKEIDPYEFEESDVDTSNYDTFKTPSGRNVPINCVSSRKKGSKSKTSSSTKKCIQKKSSKRSPRKRLTFCKPRAFSPDITDHIGSSAGLCQAEDVRHQAVVEHTESNSKKKFTSLESCVQSISVAFAKDNDTADALPTTDIVVPCDTKLVQPLPPIPNETYESLPSVSALTNETMQSDQVNENNLKPVKERDKSISDDKQDQATKIVAQKPIVQTKNVSQVIPVEAKQPVNEFLVPAPPDDSLHDAPDSMQLRRSSFYSSISRNVRTNLEKYLDGRPQDLKPAKRSKKIKNGFLLHHGDNFPDDPEAPYRLHLATQVLLKLNKRRVKCKPKEDKGKSLLSYLKLQPKRVSRVGKNSKASAEDNEESSNKEPTSVFSGEWTVPRKFVCNICGQVETSFWDMVHHKGEVHPGIVVTHVELNDDPPEGFRRPPSPRTTTTLPIPPPCTKCGSAFTNYSDLHRHIFECAGNASVLDEGTTSKVTARKKKSKRKRGFKRRISGLPKKSNITSKNATTTTGKSGEITKRRNSEVFKCEFCTREFKTEGWLKNHVSLSHSLPISIPLNKLSLPTRASISSSRRFTAQVAKPTKQLCRES